MMQVTNTTSQSAAPAQTDLLADPQFWIVTVVALIAAAFILRALLPKLGFRRTKGTSTRAQLTIERRKPE